MEENYNLGSIGEHKLKKLPNFKEIRRSTICETYEYFNKLICKKTVQEFENLNELLSSNSSLSLFDETLQVMLIDSLHLENEVVKILLSQNDCQIKRTLQCKWFFQNLSSEFCIKQLFPYISVSLRCKIINRLSKHLESIEEAEKYFEFIKTKYDSERAEYLLPRCSTEFILNYFKETSLTFEYNCGIRILLNICKRYPEVGIYIISSIFEKKKRQLHELYKYKKVLLYLAGRHLDLLVPFLKKYYSYLPSGTFGIKLTKKLGPKLKEQLFPDLVKNEIFKEKHLFSILTFEEQVKFIANVIRNKNKLSFQDWNNSENRLCLLLKCVSPEKRLRMIEEAFKELYNLNYNDYPICWNSAVLELIPTKSRQSFVAQLEKILKAQKSDLSKNEVGISFNPDYPEELIYLYESRTAFEKFKEILRKTPTFTRRESILPFMVKNCSINKDMQMLQEVVEFIAARHRNDDSSVIRSFLEAINDEFSSTSLNSTMFEKLVDVMYFTLLKGPSNHYLNQRIYSCLMEKQIYHRLEKNLNVETQLKNLFEFILQKNNSYSTFVRDVRSKHSKTLILTLCERLMPFIRNKSNEKDRSSEALLMSLLSTCWTFNQSNKSDRIYLREIPGLSDILKKKLKENFTDVGVEDWPLDIWEKFGNNVTNSYYKPNCLFYILKRNPNMIEKYLEGVLVILFSNSYKSYNAFLRGFLMNVSFFGKLEKAKEIMLNEFKNGSSTFKRKNALELYSHVAAIEEFSLAIEEYLPKQEKIEREEGGDFGEVQIFIPCLIKNVRPRWKNLQLILKFFFGDFLKTVLPSFWACCFSTRCDLAIPFLKEQLNAVPQKISYRKDIIKLIIELSDREGKFDFCRKCWDEYKHYSIRSILLHYIFKLFLQLPSKESFQLLILDPDTITFESRPKLRKIPKEFWNDYISAVWRFSECHGNPFKINFRRGILSVFDRDNIKFLSPEQSESIIKENLFNPTSELEVGDFTVLYLVSDPKLVENRVRMVLEIIKNRKPKAQYFDQFVKCLIVKSRENPTDFFEMFTVLLENWPDYPNGVLFETRILLSYHNLHQKVLKSCTDSNRTFTEFGKELRKLLAGVENLKDLLVLYVGALKDFFGSFETSNAIVAVKELTAGSQDRTLAILAILSLPPEAFAWKKNEDIIFEQNIIESKKVLNELYKTLESYNDSIVEIYLRSKFD